MAINNEYQGFTGSNYEEDDAERAKQGGFVRFSGNQINPNRINPRQDVLQKIVSDPKTLNQIVSGIKPDPKQEEFKRLDSIRERIMKTQDAIDMMVDRASYEHPGIAEDLKQGTKNYFNEFRTRYPEYDELQQNLRDYQDEYMNDPLHDEHFENALNKLRSKI